MTPDLTNEPSVSVPVESLRAGDEVFVDEKIGFCLVSAVERYDDARFVIVYFLNELENYGVRRNERRITEKQIVPKDAGDLVLAKRGAPVLADLRRRQMRDQQHHRWNTILSKSEAG